MMKENGRQGAEGERLNKFISNAGYCSRRKADELIFMGLVKVNESVVDSPGYRVKPSDRVNVEGHKIKNAAKQYILLNKSKDAITTVSDERDRKTVMDLIEGACEEKVYPVGRLDRNTTGLLVMTNDGELANRLSHPSGEVRKVYKARLDKRLAFDDLKKIREGIVLEDGFAQVDEIEYSKDEGDDAVVLTLHSGRNRIVRRIFEALEYKVKALDRVGYAGLTLHHLPRGAWRYLTAPEVKKLYQYNRKNPAGK
ncbi:MAG TPA: pseudouridine synthase [Bacteroidia bacterium]|jgi:23S rRNA pseudouridine2605 synthase|nr:pseudouridine synthase [Bacteroidia bacterium]